MPNKSEACSDACKTGSCVYKRGVEKLIRDNTVQLTATGGPVWDIEDLVEKGKEKDACPFFTARELAKNADIVFCPYNYITYIYAFFNYKIGILGLEMQ
jgi:Rad3-related DNA helicase